MWSSAKVCKYCRSYYHLNKECRISTFFFLFFPGSAANKVVAREKEKRILRVAQKTQIRAAQQEFLESLPDRMWRELIKKQYFKKDRILFLFSFCRISR